MNKENKYDSFSILLVIYFFLTYLMIFDNELRYAKYCFPFIIILLSPFLVSKNNPLNYVYLCKILKFYCLIFIISFLLSCLFTNINVRFLSNVYFVISPLVSIILMLKFYNEQKVLTYFKIVFYGAIFGFIITEMSGFKEFFENFNLFNFLINSESSLENNTYPYVFGFLFIFTIYFNLTIKYQFLSFIMMLLGSKRIVFFSTVLVIILFFLIKKKRILKKSFLKYTPLIFTLFFVLLIGIYFQFSDGKFDSLIEEYFGVNSNQLSMGRQFLYQSILNYFKGNEITGVGVGNIDYALDSITKDRDEGHIANLHSDILKNYLELGIVLSVYWIYKLSKLIIISRIHFLLFSFFFFSLITDNISIYFECLFVFYITIIFSNTLIQNNVNDKYRTK